MPVLYIFIARLKESSTPRSYQASLGIIKDVVSPFQSGKGSSKHKGTAHACRFILSAINTYHVEDNG